MSTQKHLPEGWVETTLDSVIAPERIIVRPEENLTLPFIGLEHIEAESMRLVGMASSQELKSTALHFWPGAVLYARLRPYLNKVFQTSFEGSCSAEFLVFLKSDNLNSSYLQYFLNSWEFKTFATHQVTGDRPRVDWDQLKSFKFPLPPLPEQHRIVAAIEQQLTRLDSAVASLKSAKERTKQYRASLLKAAVEGELTKEWRAEHPVEETGEQLLKRILDERRKRWEEEQLAKMREKGILLVDDSWKQKYKEPQKPDVENLPELPEGWCWATVEQLAEVGTGATPLRGRSEYYSGGTIPWVTSGSVNQSFISTTEEFITKKALAETNAKLFPPGTLILAMYGEGKTRGKVSELKIEAATNQACAAITFRPLSSRCRSYVKIFLMSNYSTIRSSAVGGVQPNLNLAIVKETIVPFPPLAEQEQIVTEVEARLSELEQTEITIEHSLKRAEHERQSILSEAFAGRLVPQDPEDEPASVLLERIREERKKREESDKIMGASRKAANVEKKRRTKRTVAGQQHLGLYEKLVEAEEPLPPEELFKRVGLKADDQPESVETFYQELSAQVDSGYIEVVKPDEKHVLLEALDHAEDETEEDSEIEEQPSHLEYERLDKPEVVREEASIYKPTLWDLEQ